jgi:hypothetical protein
MTTTTNDVRVTREPRTYRPDTSSYFLDLAWDKYPADSRRKDLARERLVKHEAEVRMETRAPTATFGDPPRWLIDRFATYPRPERILLTLIQEAGNLIPIAQRPGFSSVSTLRLTTGTATGVGSPGEVVADADIADMDVPGGAHGASDPTATDDRDPISATRLALIAGNADVPEQMLQQSGPGSAHLDQVLWKDLTADYDAKVEAQLINGAGGTGAFSQLLGLLNITGVNNVTYTDGTPTATKLIQVQATLTAGGAAPQALAQIGNKRKRKPECWLMTSSRAAWVTASEIALPLALSNQRGPGAFDLLAYPVVECDAVPTNLGAGGNQDVILCLRPSDLLVFEGAPTMSAFTETLAGTLEARVQYRCHVGAILGRYPSGISVIGGTGLAVQTALGF